jgi:hypothetical protein
MDYVLRQGETFTRWWKPQQGRWHHAEVYHTTDWLRKLIEQEPRGPKPNHRHFTIHNHGNGKFLYRPNLTADSSDFADGAYDARNVRPGANGLTLAAPGDGFAIFEVRSPYIVVPLVGHTDTDDDDREASVVEIDGAGFSLALSLDNGSSWQPIGASGSPDAIDLTSHVSGRYGYLLKVDLRGKPGEAVVRSLVLTTWVQVAPASLPSLRRGVNRMEYRTGDHYGLRTRVLEIAPTAADPADLGKYVVALPAVYEPDQPTARMQGELVARIEPPPGAKIAWFAAQGSFRAHQRERAAETRNTMSYAVDTPASYREFYRAQVPADTDHWHCNAHEEVKLDAPANRLFVRYMGDPALNNFRVYAHCLDDSRRSDSPVTVVHAWRENGGLEIRRVALDDQGEYEIDVAGEPDDEFIELAVPSR